MIPAVWSKAVINFVTEARLVASLSGVSAKLQGEVNVVSGVAVYLYLIDVPQHLGLLQTNILPLSGLLWNL